MSLKALATSVLFLASEVASAAVASKPGQCADFTAATQPCKAKGCNYYHDVGSYFYYGPEPCSELSQFNMYKSIQFFYDVQANGGNGAYICNVFNKTVAEYTVPCSKSGSVPLTTFFDNFAPSPAMSTTGSVPQKPSTDPKTGTCNGQRVFNGNQTQIIGNVVGTAYETSDRNISQGYCGGLCQVVDGCKSYLFVPNTINLDYVPYNKTAPQESEFSTCVLYSQPVSEMTVASTNGKKGGFYDRNCPLSPYVA